MKRFANKKMIAGAVLLFTAFQVAAQTTDYPIQPVAFTQVNLVDNFWAPKIQVNADITIPYTLQQCKTHERIDNFLRAAGKIKDDKYTQFTFDDTDIYKVIEGASYAMQQKQKPAMEQYIDSQIDINAAAQQPDGYLYTFRTMQPTKPHEWVGKERWA
jgi:DUF1680 family protein